MEIKFPSNLTDKKYGKFAESFNSPARAIECAEQGHAVICWDKPDDPDEEPLKQVVFLQPDDPDEEPLKQVAFLQSVTYTRTGTKFKVMTQAGFVLTYDHALCIGDEHCPRVFVKTESGAGAGRLIGIQCDGDMAGDNPKFLVRLLPFEGGIWDTVTADQLLFVDDAKMGVAKEG